jgi:hypothetical protein
MSFNPDPDVVPLAPSGMPGAVSVDRVELDSPPNPTRPPVIPAQVSVTTESSPEPIEVQFEAAQAQAELAAAEPVAVEPEGAVESEAVAQPPGPQAPADAGVDAPEPPPLSPDDPTSTQETTVGTTTEGEAPLPEGEATPPESSA